jgi:YbbR domain-containing protein
MKRILSVFAAIVLFAAAGAANAADASNSSNSQPTTCQGPASQCNVFFGQ